MWRAYSTEGVIEMGAYSGMITSMKQSCSSVAGSEHEAWCTLQAGFTYNHIVNPSQLNRIFIYRSQSAWAVCFIDLNSLTYLLALSISVFSLVGRSFNMVCSIK